ncbi:MAG: glycine C-acetyltransferase [Bryobacter sp.]|nr:glycine C-acetyltransferase [Bryobacter sp.]
MYGSTQQRLAATLDEIRAAGLFKNERVITTPQRPQLAVSTGAKVLNLCANNYLGLADHPAVIAAAREALERWGFGMASVRFICGTQEIHKRLEQRIAAFLQTEDCILYTSCWDANGGLFEIVLGEEDAVISDELNHASIIDGIRLSKAARYRYRNCDLADLEAKLVEAREARTRLIATDGVFSMDGTIAPLKEICDLADRHDALVMVDDSHAVGFLGDTGRGSIEHRGVLGRVDIVTGTLGKALGGASGGYTAARKEIVDLLRQRSRPYLFSNSVAPPIVAATLKVLELIEREGALIRQLAENTRFFRERMTALGFRIVPGEHPIVPIMFGDAKLAVEVAERMLARGVYVIAFSYPVVPHGKARIRTQMSAAHTRAELEFAIEQFAAVKAEMGI